MSADMNSSSYPPPRPAPEGGGFDYLQAEDGTRLRFGVWKPLIEPRGSVVLQGGFREFIDKHFEEIDDLLLKGYAVYAMDWRGQGGSDRPLENRQKVYVDSFDTHIADFELFLRLVVTPDAPEPVFLIAHSMGGHLALRHLAEHPGRFQSAVLSAPMVDIKFIPGFGALSHSVIRLGLRLGWDRKYAPGQGDYGRLHRAFKGNVLTSDRARFEAEHAHLAAKPDLACGGATFGWLGAAFDSVAVLKSDGYAERITTPVSIVQAGKDQLVDNRAQEKLVQRLPNGLLYTIEGAKHELLRERNEIRNQFWKIFDRAAEQYTG
ncbi:MAG: alpha/beta hydrolase [Alphaproteobacteria bacterium]|nr:alpha/beta hydrolase [Alphaproteobacteria bacterium]